MTASKLSRFWAVVIILLVVITIIGGTVAWLKRSLGESIEISIPQRQEPEGVIYIGGAVAVPGFYSFTSNESFETLIKAAGGATENATLSGVKLYIPQIGGGKEPQKIDINRAELWLLEALPGIGEVLAQRIVDYRQQNGPFQNTREIARVAGIGTVTYEKIKDFITVAD